MSKALSGIRVIDFSRILAGPYCTMMLADLGAEVIKIERPVKGDDSRAYGPYKNGESLYFMSVNRGKKSIVLNLKNEKAKNFLIKLIQTADVLVENFKPGVMERLGLDYETLSQVNPRLIYASASGFGQTGPYAHKPSYDLIIQGMSGMMSITGPDANTPTKVGMSVADVDTGIFTCVGVLAALYQREKTGRGQHVDIAMLDCLLAILENAATRCLYTGIAPTALGNHHAVICPFATVQTSDGQINIACGNDTIFAKFSNLIGEPWMPTDPRFDTNFHRNNNWDELSVVINNATRKRTSAEWLAIFDAEGVPSGPINTMKEIVADPQVHARGMIQEIPHATAGSMQAIASPVHLSENPHPVYEGAPVLGADSAKYIAEILGCSEQEAQKIVDEKQFE